MHDSKILRIGEQGGMAHLQNEANPPKAKPKQDDPGFPEGKCLKARCILEGVDYYIPNGEALFDGPPYHPFSFAIGYSVLANPGSVVPTAIIKHTEKRFFQTGFTTEIVDLPAWWNRRDQGV